MENKDLPVATWADVREGAVLMYVPSRAELKVTATTADRIECIVTVSTRRWEPVGSQWRGGKRFVDSGAYRLVSPAPSATPRTFDDVRVGQRWRWTGEKGSMIAAVEMSEIYGYSCRVLESNHEYWPCGGSCMMLRHEFERGEWTYLGDAPEKADVASERVRNCKEGIAAAIESAKAQQATIYETSLRRHTASSTTPLGRAIDGAIKAIADASTAEKMDAVNDAYAARQRQDVRNILAGWARADMNAANASLHRTSRK